MAAYLQTQTAPQREGVIRDAKFPRKPNVVSYSRSRRILCDFLSSNSGSLADLKDDIAHLETRWRREPDGWMKTEVRRNIDAIEAFKKCFTATRAKRYTFGPPQDISFRLEGVLVHTRLDAIVTETDSTGLQYLGGCLLYIAASEAARKNMAERSKTAAAVIHWTLQKNENVEPIERLCMSFDVFGGTITKAPKAVDRLRDQMTKSCREVSALWDDTEPPPGYDGPDWR